MAGDPSRRPSNERSRVVGDLQAIVWIECSTCLGDGWHYPDGGRKNRKIMCGVCSGVGARQIMAIELSPGARTVSAPKGHRSTGGQ